MAWRNFREKQYTRFLREVILIGIYYNYMNLFFYSVLHAHALNTQQQCCFAESIMDRLLGLSNIKRTD